MLGETKKIEPVEIRNIGLVECPQCGAWYERKNGWCKSCNHTDYEKGENYQDTLGMEVKANEADRK